MSDPYHYPPELLEQLVETIPRLVRSKKGLLDFFESAGVEKSLMSDLRAHVLASRDTINKFEIVRTVLKRLNDGGDRTLAARREVLKRVCEWEDFSTCWDQERLKAQGLVAEIRRVVNIKDSFTRMNLAREAESRRNKEEYERRAAAKHKREAALADVRVRLGRCLAGADPHARGIQLESVLNDYFRVEGVSVRDAFRVVGQGGAGVVEQIDGAVEVDGTLYVVEMKCWSRPLGEAEVSPFLVKVFTRDTGGIFIAHPGITGPAEELFEHALVKGKTTFACTLEAVFRVLEGGGNLPAFLRQRIQSARLDRRPYLDRRT
ncbi:MAG TPA: restriction endonuclease [Polyangia bacterium]|jgi:hypothetical protein